MEYQPKFLSRKPAGEFLRAHGYPIGESTFDKLCSPAVGQGPPIAKWWGKRALYEPDALLAWALSRTRDPDATEHAAA